MIDIDPDDHLSIWNLGVSHASYSLRNAGESDTKLELHIIMIDQIK